MATMPRAANPVDMPTEHEQRRAREPTQVVVRLTEPEEAVLKWLHARRGIRSTSELVRGLLHEEAQRLGYWEER